MSRPYSHCAMRPLWCRPLSRVRTPCGLPMKSVPTWFLMQKSMTLRVALWRRSRTRRSARRHTLFFARCNFFQRRECFLQRLCFLGELSELSASLPLEGADTAPGDDKRLASAGGHGGQVDLPEVNGC